MVCLAVALCQGGPAYGADVYSPITGKGYAPLVQDTNWIGVMDQLHIKDEYGCITSGLPKHLECAA